MCDLRRIIESAALESGVDLQTARRIEDHFAAVWGGRRVYIQKPSAAKHEHRAQAIGAAVAAGASIAEACAELGISRSTVYRLRREARSSAIGKRDRSE